jgi:protein TonB
LEAATMLVAVLLALALQPEALDGLAAAIPPTGAKWVSEPSQSEFKRAFPEKADRKGVGGKAVLQCVFTAAGRLSRCVVASETPAGLGFGEAALKLAPLFRAVATPAGATLQGEPIMAPIAFRASRPE